MPEPNDRTVGRESATRPDYGVAPPGYRLPAEARLGPVTLDVASLARSLDYYRSVLGLRVLATSDAEATLGAGDRPLVELREVAGAGRVPSRGRLGLYHFAILLPDRAALGRFLLHLAEIGVRPGAADHRVSEALYLHDPDGLGIEVYADRPRSAWRTTGRELQMATDPLDSADVARAAGGRAWGGMPAGARIGHLHLHVGDLERADAFYHAALGFDRMVWSYPGALFLAAGGYHHHLGVNTWAADQPAAEPGDARLREWELVLPSTEDVDAAAESVRAAGHEVENDGADRIVRDAWGTVLRLRADEG
jgi:catechol 2,3-dioxygenase